MNRNIFKHTISIAISLLALSAGAQEPYADSLSMIDADGVGIYIESLTDGSVVLDVNGEMPLVPASVTKLVTAASVVNSVDIDRSYSTKLYADGKLKNGTLEGNLVVVPSGDPTIESAHFPAYKGVADSMARYVRLAGIEKIAGSIVVEAPDNLAHSQPPGWKDSDAAETYGAGHHALNYADNIMVLSMPSGKTLPAVPDLKINKIAARKGHSISRKPESATIDVRAPRKKRFDARLANPSPQSSFVAALKSALAAEGVDCASTPLAVKGPTRELVYEHLSPPIKDILKSMMMRSDNMMAEASLRLLAPQGSREDAIARELTFLNDKIGADTVGLRINDGSGLSRLNRLSPYVLADVLVWMLDHSPRVDEYLQMFPKAGVSGTLRSFLKGTELEGRFVAKTGSVNGVQCYAGYLLNYYGMPTHVVVVMINGMKCDRSTLKSRLQRLLIEKLL